MPIKMNVLEIVHYLGSVPENELEMIAKKIEKVRDDRANQRRRELWGNVKAAIKKYCDVIGEGINVVHPYSDGVICLDSLDECGVLYAACE